MNGKNTSELSATQAVEAAYRELRDVIGDSYVQIDDETLSRYSRDMGPWRERCALVVFPGNSSEVQSVLATADRHQLDVWPFSTGKNWGYGATVANKNGAIVLMLERMNRIIEVNEQLGYVVIEPGVTQQQLHEHLKVNHPGLWMDCTDSTPLASVLGNALERGVGYTKYGDHFGNLCGLEVVLPGGEIIQTGGGPNDCKTWHTYKYGLGPYAEGLFSQSSLGVVTRGGIWLMPKPADFRAYFLDVEDERDAPNVIDALRRLTMTGAVQSNVHMVNNYLFLTLVQQYPFADRGDAPCLSEDQIRKVCEGHAIPPWSLVGALYGTSAQVAANVKLIRKELSRFGKLTFVDDAKAKKLQGVINFCNRWENHSWWGAPLRLLRKTAISPKPIKVLEVLKNVYPILQGVPSDFIVRNCEYFKCQEQLPRGEVDPVKADSGQGLMWLAPVVPLASENVSEVLQLCQPEFHNHKLEFALSFIQLNARSVVMLMPLMYERGGAEQERAKSLYETLRQELWSKGYCEYRTSNENKAGKLPYLALPSLRRRQTETTTAPIIPSMPQMTTEAGSGMAT